MESEKSFANEREEINYWKSQAFSYKNGYEEQKKDYDEYQENSKLIETEYEIQLKQNESRIDSQLTKINRYEEENENLKAQLEQMRREHGVQYTELSTELGALRKNVDFLKNHVRQLEQKNDDLERANRAAAVSIDDFEAKLNLAIERNAFLESEIEEKDNLRTIVQRLKDESRDLRSDLQVRIVEPQDKFLDSNKLIDGNKSKSSPLNIVNDVLKKIGVLENKLSTYHAGKYRKVNSKQLKT